jgi:hypothetical protein
MSIYTRDHIHFSMSGISLRRLQVSVIELQFIGTVGMTEFMLAKNDD